MACHGLYYRGKPVDVNVYKAEPVEFKLWAEINYQKSEHDAPTVNKHEKFLYRDWIKWEQSVYAYFELITNSNYTPFAYVIWKDLNGKDHSVEVSGKDGRRNREKRRRYWLFFWFLRKLKRYLGFQISCRVVFILLYSTYSIWSPLVIDIIHFFLKLFVGRGW